MLQGLLQNEFLMSVLAFALVLIPAIIIHELGHFLAAKMAGISVLEFGIGWPPRLARLFRWGETEIVLNWLPIGGYVMPLGEDMAGPVNEEVAEADEDDAEEKPKHRYEDMRSQLRERGVADEDMVALQDASAGSRIIFMAAGALANVASAIVLFIIVALIGLPEVVGARTQLVQVPQNSVFAQAGVEIGDVIERVNGEMFPTTQDFLQQLVASQDEPITLSLRRAETGDEYEVTLTPGVDTLSPYIFVGGIAEGSPAEAARLRPGDLITALDGVQFDLEDPISTMQARVIEKEGQTILLDILRDGEPYQVTLTPRVNPPAGEGRIGVVIDAVYATNNGVIFVNSVAQEAMIPQPLDKAVSYGINQTGEIIGTVISLPRSLIEGTISPEEARPVSVVGISRIGARFLQQSIDDGTPQLILNFIAMVSIFLGITNLLPVPPLDGGRILFVLIEVLRGKPISPRIEATIISVCMYIILGLAVLIIIYDIINPLTLPT